MYILRFHISEASFSKRVKMNNSAFTTGSIAPPNRGGARGSAGAHWWRLMSGLIVFAVVVVVVVVVVTIYVYRKKKGDECLNSGDCKGTQICGSAGTCVDSGCTSDLDKKRCNGFCKYDDKKQLSCSCDGSSFAAPLDSVTADHPYCPIKGLLPYYNDHKKMLLVIGSALGGVVLLSLIGIGVMMKHGKSRQNYHNVDDYASSLASDDSFDESEFARPL